MLGRDIFSRIIYGTRSVLSLTGLGSLLAVVIGTIFGLASGYWGGVLDELIMRAFDSLLAIPALLLALVLLGAVGQSQASVLVVITVVYVPIVARIVRSEVLSVKSLGYIEAARLRGESFPYILFREILPSVLPSLSVEAALRFSYGIFLVASLGYLGVGVQPPTPDWGLMVKEARNSVGLTPWALYFPAGAISLLVIAVNLTADGLKSVLQSSAQTLSFRERSRILKARREHAFGASVDGKTSPEGEDAMLKAHHLTASYRVESGWIDALRDVSLEIRPGETLGVVGESGSGKSTLALAIVQYLSSNGAVRSGSLHFEGASVLGRSRRALRDLRSGKIALIPQDPMASLNPSIRVGHQVAEVLQQQERRGKTNLDRRVIELISRVHIPDPDRVAQQYPHHLSGGMQQRIVIAMALAANPKLLILDEPTTGLDVTTEAAILDLVAELLSEGGRSALYISHDLGVVARVSDRIAVLYAGELLETGPVDQVFRKPGHPYTVGLLASIPRFETQASECELPSMEGIIPSPAQLLEGCVFRPRCPLATDQCIQRPELVTLGLNHEVRCHHRDQVAESRDTLFSQAEARKHPHDTAPSHPALELRDVKTRFPIRRSVQDLIAGSSKKFVQAVNGVSLTVQPGSTLGIVGESGSGKTTLARSILGLTPRSEGDLLLGEIVLSATLAKRSRDQLREIQAVSQNPDQALTPHLPIGISLKRQMVRLTNLSRNEIHEATANLLIQVGLTEDYASRLPSQLSGGEKQRVAIARSIAADSGLIVCDEATSSLDVSVQARILNLLARLQSETGRAYILITHDLAVVGYLSDQIAVMYLGKLMEIGTRDHVLAPPYHPYTEALLSSYPAIDRDAQREPIRLSGEVPSPVDLPTGCPFHSRCPRFIGSVCRDLAPRWQDDENGHAIACHISMTELATIQMKQFGASELTSKDGA
jgi:peptide/nickel transport system ATP-binding protein